MKRFLCTILLLVICVSTVGCSDNEAELPIMQLYGYEIEHWNPNDCDGEGYDRGEFVRIKLTGEKGQVVHCYGSDLWGVRVRARATEAIKESGDG